MKPWHSDRRRGFALMIVISVLALIIIYLAAADVSIQTTHNLKRLQERRLEVQEAVAQVVAELARPGAPEEFTLKLDDTRALAGRRTALSAESAVWREVPGLAPRPGDALISLSGRGILPEFNQRCLANLQGARRGVIMLGPAAAPEAAATTAPLAAAAPATPPPAADAASTSTLGATLPPAPAPAAAVAIAAQAAPETAAAQAAVAAAATTATAMTTGTLPPATTAMALTTGTLPPATTAMAATTATTPTMPR